MLTNSIVQKAFANPQQYRNSFLNARLIQGEISKFSGKTFICVSLTRFCPVGCKFCFFKSGTAFRKTTREDVITEEGMEKFVQFANTIDLGYLLVSGGGEPMMEKDSILKIIREVQSERIVLVTSAYWAKKLVSAEKYLHDIKNALSQRNSETTVTIRVSVDSEHTLGTAALGLDPIVNLIHLFSNEYKSIPQLNLQIHSLVDDPSIGELISLCKENYNVSRRSINQQRISDGVNVVKIVPKQEIISFNDLEIKVGYAKAFYSDLRVNIQDSLAIQKNIDVYQKDLFESEDGNSSIVTNKLGNPGLDYWVNYNGNVTTWGNQYLDNLFNFYVDTPDSIINGTLNDPAALSFIEKGANYRDRIVAEANEIAVIRSKAVNIRDYTGALMFDEARTRLYYTIRSLQDYIQEGRIKEESLKKIPNELRQLLSAEKDELIAAYNETPYNIVEQTIESTFNKDKILDILEWIKLGHYKLREQDIERLIDFYNVNVADHERINGKSILPHNLKMQIVRMTEHLTHIKKSAVESINIAKPAEAYA